MFHQSPNVLPRIWRLHVENYFDLLEVGLDVSVYHQKVEKLFHHDIEGTLSRVQFYLVLPQDIKSFSQVIDMEGSFIFFTSMSSM